MEATHSIYIYPGEVERIVKVEIDQLWKLIAPRNNVRTGKVALEGRMAQSPGTKCVFLVGVIDMIVLQGFFLGVPGTMMASGRAEPAVCRRIKV